MNYTSEVEFLRAEVEKCHASMHSQIETINLLMKKNIELKQKRQWVGLTAADIKEIWKGEPMILPWDTTRTLAIEAKLKEKNT